MISEALAGAAEAAVLLKTNNWLVWQLMDSAFPTGGFAHSSGLEAAWQHGEVRGRDELVSFVKSGLEQLGHAALPFVTAAFDEPEKLGELDRLCDVFTTNHVANRASRAQGRAFLSAVERIFKLKTGNQKIEIQFKGQDGNSLPVSLLSLAWTAFAAMIWA